MNLLNHAWEISEDQVKDLLKREKSFRSEWAGFATRSNELFDDFRTKGASLPKEFLDQLAALETRKQTLYHEVYTETQSIPSSVWRLPQATADLHDLEVSLERLRDLCRQHEQELRDWGLRIQAPLDKVSRLTTIVADVGDVLRTALTKIRSLAAPTAKVDGTSRESLERTSEASKALLEILSECVAARTAADNSELANALPLTEFASYFEKVDNTFGRNLALAAVRGHLQLQGSFGPAVSVENANALSVEPRVSAEGLSQLKKRFNESRDKIDSPRSPRHVESQQTFRMTAADAERELQPAIDQLRQRSAALRAESVLHPHRSDQNVEMQVLGYENLADIAVHLIQILRDRDATKKDNRRFIEVAAQLMAEAQSAVRTAAEENPIEDSVIAEQGVIFRWLKEFVSEECESILLRQYMRLDDRADPANNAKVGQKITKLTQHWQQAHAAPKLLKMIQAAVQELTQTGDVHAINRIDLLVQRYLQGSANYSDARLRDLLFPAIERLPEWDEEPAAGSADISDEFRQVLKNLDLHLEQQAIQGLEIESANDSEEVSAELSRVRNWLKGETMALIGGTPKPEHRKRIEEALLLKSLNWIPASKTDRVSDLQPQLGDAKLLVVITKLIGHKHNDLRRYCNEQGIHWVQTKKSQGWGVNQLVSVIIEQVSEQLDQAA